MRFCLGGGPAPCSHAAMKRVLLGLAVCTLLAACDKDKPAAPAASAEPSKPAAAAPAASAPAKADDDEGGW